MQVTHKRKDGKVSAQLLFISGDTVVYHRSWTERGRLITSNWGRM